MVRRDGRQEPSICSESAPSRRSLPAAGTACLRSQALELSGYTAEEKLQIARRYLVARQLKANGLEDVSTLLPRTVLTPIVPTTS